MKHYIGSIWEAGSKNVILQILNIEEKYFEYIFISDGISNKYIGTTGFNNFLIHLQQHYSPISTHPNANLICEDCKVFCKQMCKLRHDIYA